MNQKGPSLPIRITDGKDPDTGSSCKILEINGLVVPFWISQAKITEMEAKIIANKESKNPILIHVMDSFLSLVEKCINRRLTLSELISAVEAGVIVAGPPPEGSI